MTVSSHIYTIINLGLFSMSRPLIFGMVHLRALPGTPLNKMPYREIKKIGKQTMIFFDLSSAPCIQLYIKHCRKQMS